MKQKKIHKKLSFEKVTISDLEMKKVDGGAAIALTVQLTCDYSDCGTGPVTIAPCMCPTNNYSQCGTGPITIHPCMCG